MTPEQIAEILKTQFGDKIVEGCFETAHPHVVVAADGWRQVAEFLKSDDRLRFNMLRCLTVVDMLEDEQFVIVCDVHAAQGENGSAENWTEGHEFCIKIRLPRGEPRLASVADIWPAAEWHEREAYDMMGIVFENHPDSVDGPEGRHPRRILCPDDWVGYPLRKDYEFPMEYHGIPAVTEYGQTRPVH